MFDRLRHVLGADVITEDAILQKHIDQFTRSGVVGRRNLDWNLRHGLDFLLISDYQFRHERQVYPYIAVKFVTHRAFFSCRQSILDSIEVFNVDHVELAMKAFLIRKRREDIHNLSGLGQPLSKLREVIGLQVN